MCLGHWKFIKICDNNKKNGSVFSLSVFLSNTIFHFRWCKLIGWREECKIYQRENIFLIHLNIWKKVQVVRAGLCSGKLMLAAVAHLIKCF